MNQEIEKEIKEAREKYGPFNSTHELYAVLAEEMDEFFDVVKLSNRLKESDQYDSGKPEKMKHELMQIAAIAIRGAIEIEDRQIKWI